MSPPSLRRRYFDAAHEILSTQGYGALKLAAVCRRLNVTTGAFYHSFDSWQEFKNAFLEDWLQERTEATAEVARALSDPVNQLELLLRAAVDLRHASEAAIRVWANTDPEVAAMQRTVDAARFTIVHEIAEKLVGPDDASRYAWWALNVLVGFEQSSHPQTTEDLYWQLEQVLAVATAARSV